MACCCFADTADETDNDFARRRASTKRSLRATSFTAAATNLTRIFEELKCPICFNVCVPPIHNCINGHIVCDNCLHKGNVTSCPTCRESLQGARNYFAENFIVNYAQQCRYASQGCEHLRLKGCSMKPHEEKCRFRPLKCIASLCRSEIPYKNLLSHLDFAHKASGTNKLPTSVQFKYTSSRNTKKTKWLPFYIQAFGNVYYVMMQRVKKNYWIWVYSQTSKESDELEYTHCAYIKLKHPEKKITHSWHGPVYPIRTTFKTIMNEGCCFMLPEMIVKNFVSQLILNFTVDIRKIPRTSFKDVKLPDEDSDTAVASSLPAEYNRPPSFYEPIMPALPQPPSQTPSEQHTAELDENGNIINSKPSSPKTAMIRHLARPRLRTAAIGIPGGYPGLSETTSSLSSVGNSLNSSHNRFEIPPAEMSGFKSDEEKNFIDVITTQSNAHH